MMTRRLRKIIVDNSTSIIYVDADSVANANISNKFGVLPSNLIAKYGGSSTSCSLRARGIGKNIGHPCASQTYLEEITIRVAKPSLEQDIVLELRVGTVADKLQTNSVQLATFNLPFGSTEITLPVDLLLNANDRMFFNILQVGIGKSGTGKGFSFELKYYKE